MYNILSKVQSRPYILQRLASFWNERLFVLILNLFIDFQSVLNDTDIEIHTRIRIRQIRIRFTIKIAFTLQLKHFTLLYILFSNKGLTFVLHYLLSHKFELRVKRGIFFTWNNFRTIKRKSKNFTKDVNFYNFK